MGTLLIHDIPKKNIYNADECATNTYDHRKRTIGLASKFGRAFQITPGGDGRMPFHITNMITSCSSGIYNVPIEGVQGAPPPMIIHACSASPEKDNCTDLQSSSEEFYQNPAFSEGLSEPYSVSAFMIIVSILSRVFLPVRVKTKNQLFSLWMVTHLDGMSVLCSISSKIMYSLFFFLRTHLSGHNRMIMG